MRLSVLADKETQEALFLMVSVLPGSRNDNVASDYYPWSVTYIIDDLATLRDTKGKMRKSSSLKEKVTNYILQTSGNINVIVYGNVFISILQ